MVMTGTPAPSLIPAPAPPLLGWVFAVTGERRGADLVALLESHGARTVHVPAVRTVALTDPAALYEVTATCLAQPFDTVVVTTGSGFGAWLEAADGWGMGELLRTALGSARILARGQKASGAVHAAGLPDTDAGQP